MELTFGKPEVKFGVGDINISYMVGFSIKADNAEGQELLYDELQLKTDLQVRAEKDLLLIEIISHKAQLQS